MERQRFSRLSAATDECNPLHPTECEHEMFGPTTDEWSDESEVSGDAASEGINECAVLLQSPCGILPGFWQTLARTIASVLSRLILFTRCPTYLFVSHCLAITVRGFLDDLIGSRPFFSSGWHRVILPLPLATLQQNQIRFRISTPPTSTSSYSTSDSWAIEKGNQSTYILRCMQMDPMIVFIGQCVRACSGHGWCQFNSCRYGVE